MWPEEPWPSIEGTNVQPGDFRVVRPRAGKRARMVMVWEVWENDGFANVALIADSTDIRGFDDILLRGSETGLPFDVVVETDVIVSVPLDAFGPLLGRLVGFSVDDVMYGLPERRGVVRAPAVWKDVEIGDAHGIGLPPWER